MSETTVRAIVRNDLPADEYTRRLSGAGEPEPLAQVLADCDLGLARGALPADTGDLAAPVEAIAAAIRSATPAIVTASGAVSDGGATETGLVTPGRLPGAGLCGGLCPGARSILGGAGEHGPAVDEIRCRLPGGTTISRPGKPGSCDRDDV
ncbi:hypothetical protein [Streptomyces sp. NPDC046862]|uniref:hypothetical protein n=1 Tax=Streptomyces sp. NPDC046862 TaxID=3154603 RepID=UPI0034525579